MYKVVGGDRKEYGPVTADEVRRWIAEGRLSAQSYILAEGAGQWKTLAAFPEFSEALRTQPNYASVASAAAGVVLSPEVWSAQILMRQPTVKIGRCLARSGRLLTANFGVLFGATLLVWLASMIFQWFVPFIGPIIYWVLRGVFYGGLFLVCLNRIRGKPASVGEVFAGFGLAFAQLMLAGLVSSFLSAIGALFCLLPGIYLFVAWIFGVPLVADKRLEFWSAMELSRKVVTKVWFEMFGLLVLAFLPFILTYMFAEIKITLSLAPVLQDILAHGPPDFARLLETIKEIAKTSVPLVLLIKLVFLLNLPFGAGALMYGYEDLFGARTEPAA